MDEAAELRVDIAFFTAIRAVIVKHTTVDRKRTEESKNSALKQILDNALVSEGVTDIFALAGVERPNIGLLSDEFLEDVRKMPAKNLAVELLERLMRDEIKSSTRGNVVQEKKFSDRLLETIRKYHNRAIETQQVIEELIAGCHWRAASVRCRNGKSTNRLASSLKDGVACCLRLMSSRVPAAALAGCQCSPDEVGTRTSIPPQYQRILHPNSTGNGVTGGCRGSTS